MVESAGRLRKYEAVIILDSGKAGAEWEGVLGRVRGMMERHGAELESLGKWDERKLAYEIKGHKRGTYVLARFAAPTKAIAAIRRDFELSEDVIRALIVLRDEKKEKAAEEMKTARREEARASAAPAGEGSE